ncbi:MAG: hypothetical protein JWO36_4208 [Myxococcales bacterium]|nr:hypothetical protein [Myxococcales bacterium]
MKKLAFIGSALGLALGALLIVHTSQAADHADAPGTMANPMADINDVYAWMTPDGNSVNLVMTVSPADDGTRHFGPTVEYVFHVSSSATIATAGTATETKVICKFANDNSAQCWVGNAYIAGNPQGAGIENGDHTIKLFAGRRSDPFFFNLQGFRDVVASVEANAGTLMTAARFDAAGCPDLSGPVFGPIAANLRATLSEAPVATAPPPCAQDDSDCFIHLNVKAIVLQVDKRLLTPGGPVLGVWGSTHTTP